MNQGTIYLLIALGGVFVITLLLILVVALFRNIKKDVQPYRQKKLKLASSLRDEQIKSDFIVNAIEDGVVLIDDQQVIRLFNPGASKITGWDSKEAIGLDFRSVIKLLNDKGVAFDSTNDPFSKVFQTQKPLRDNTVGLVSRNEKHFSISLSVSPILDETGKLSAVVGVFQDISEERQEEQQRAEFISTASHEMRTPVAAIEGYLSLALNDKVATIDNRAKGYLERAHSSTQSLGKLFQDLLTSAKAEDGRLSTHPTVIDMSGFLTRLTDDLRFIASKKGLKLVFAVGSGKQTDHDTGPGNVVPPLYYILADQERIKEIVINLFENAVKFTNEGKITIGLTGNNSVVQFYVRDTGTGIATEDIPHLFQKFYRVDNSKTRTFNGTGLGLFICRKIVELYQGQIWVESELGKGSTFYVNLPRLNSQKAAELKTRENASK